MGIFNNSFFSIAGQLERIKNVGAVLNAALNPFSKDKVVANTPSTTLNKALETAANHPYVAAGLGAVVAAPAAAGAAVVQVAKTAAPIVAKVAIEHPIAAAAAVPVGIVTTGIVLKSPTAREELGNAPANLAQFGGNIGEFIENPSLETAKEIFTENPLISSVVGAAAGVALVKTATSVANIVTTERNTKALENMANNPSAAIGSPSSGSQLIPDKTLSTNEDMPITSPTTTISTGKRKRRKAQPKEMPSINQRVNIVVANKNTSTGIRVNKKYINREVLAY